jgi:hypothetical protein
MWVLRLSQQGCWHFCSSGKQHFITGVWDYHVIFKHQTPIIQWYTATSHKNTDYSQHHFTRECFWLEFLLLGSSRMFPFHAWWFFHHYKMAPPLMVILVCNAVSVIQQMCNHLEHALWYPRSCMVACTVLILRMVHLSSRLWWAMRHGVCISYPWETQQVCNEDTLLHLSWRNSSHIHPPVQWFYLSSLILSDLYFCTYLRVQDQLNATQWEESNILHMAQTWYCSWGCGVVV